MGRTDNISKVACGRQVWAPCGWPLFISRLTGYHKAEKQVPPNEGLAYCAQHPDKFVINKTSAPAGDGFCSITANSKSVLEVHQNKHIKDTLTKAMFDNEVAKSAGAEDFFIAFTTHGANIREDDLKPRRAVVSKQEFQAYFGPYAGRAFYTKKHINKATEQDLMEAHGIGLVTASKIIVERNANGPFSSREDLQQRTNLKRTWSDTFSYDGL